jgi:hypothetical protein
MSRLYALYAISDAAAANKPHILAFNNARTVANDTLLEIWNGNTSADRRLVLDLDGCLTLGSGAAQSGQVRIGNNKAIAARNAAGTADVELVKLDGGNNMILGASIVPAAHNAQDLGTAGVQWRNGWFAGTLTLGTASITTLTVAGDASVGGELVAGVIRRATADGADNSVVQITGGGAFAGDGSRGAFIQLYGNEHGSTGGLDLAAGFVAGGVVRILAGGNERVRVTDGGVLAIGTSMVTGALAGDVVTAHGKFLRSVDTAGTGVFPIVGGTAYGATNVVQLGNMNIVVIGAPGSVAGAAVNELVLSNAKGLRSSNAAGTNTTSLIELTAADVVKVAANGAVMALGNPASTGAANAGDVVIASARALRHANNAGTTTLVLIESTATDGIRVAPGSILSIGSPGSVNTAAAGDAVLANARYLRAANPGGTDTKTLIGMDANSIVRLGDASLLEPVAVPAYTSLQIPAAAAARSGGLAVETTNNWLVYYSGGTRYRVAGVAF